VFNNVRKHVVCSALLFTFAARQNLPEHNEQAK
jgi:hypothetical protein